MSPPREIRSFWWVFQFQEHEPSEALDLVQVAVGQPLPQFQVRRKVQVRPQVVERILNALDVMDGSRRRGTSGKRLFNPCESIPQMLRRYRYGSVSCKTWRKSPLDSRPSCQSLSATNGETPAQGSRWTSLPEVASGPLAGVHTPGRAGPCSVADWGQTYDLMPVQDTWLALLPQLDIWRRRDLGSLTRHGFLG